ncbi:MAG: DUF4347 domain-containing protein, partial [Nitrospira sp.]|nr:DUF4347 domain-containing protein [Nitrospira sp.]
MAGHVVKGRGADPSANNLLLSLESRIMFDGAAVVTTGAVVVQQGDQQADSTTTLDGATTMDTASVSTAGESSGEGDAALFDALTVLDASTARQEIVFIDSSIEDYEVLTADVNPNATVVLLNSSRDGIQQIAEYLASQQNVDAIHIVSHGSGGTLQLGTAILNIDTMSQEYAALLSQIGSHLSEASDILVYGCEFGKGEAGQAAAMRLSELTGADVSASEDLTGAAELGGDWDLELDIGQIETGVVFGEQGQANFDHILPPPSLDLDSTDTGSFNAAVAFTEQTPVAIAPSATLTDPDGDQIASLTATLSARPDGDMVESLSLNQASTTAAAGLTVTYNPATGILSISGNATAATYEAILRGITYNNTSDNPTTTTRSVSVSVTDATNKSATRTVNINSVTRVDDAPNIVDASVSVNENSANGMAVVDVSDSFTSTDQDRDGQAITYSITGGNASGAFAIDSATGVISVADSTLLDRETISSFTLTVQASDGSLTDTAAITINLSDVDEFDVGAISDTNGTTNAVNENAAMGTLVGITASASDADATTNTMTYSLTDNAGGRFQIDGSTGVVTVLDGTLLDYESATSHSITVRADSADGSFSTQTYTINVNNVNEAPTAVALTNQVTTIAENTVIGAGYKVADIAITDDALGTNGLSLTGTDAASFTIVGSALYYTGASPNYESGKTSYAVTVNVDDVGVGATPDASVNFTLSVTDVNEAPTLTGDLSATVAEGGTYTITGTDLGFSDVDDVAAGVTFTVSGLTNGTVEVNGTAATTFTGTQLAAGQVVFRHDGSETATASFAVNVEDGNEDGSVPVDSTFTVTVTPVNDAPTATITAATFTATEQISLSLVAGGLSVADVDGPSVTASLRVGEGVLNVTAGATGATVLDSGTGTVTISGTQAQINAVLAGNSGATVAYVNGSDTPSASTTLTLTADDGTTASSDTATISVTAVNDPPTLTVTGTNNFTEDAPGNAVGSIVA